jgi:DNA-binding GntR family transcriptional regulator
MRVQRQAPPVRAQVSEILRQAIRDMRFKPGQRLVERELVELTGVSRTSIREALRELAAEGLVQSIPNKGMVVAGLTPREADQLYELRSSLEGLAGKLFVQRATDAQVAELRRAFELIRRCTDHGVGLLEAKDDFYEILFEGADNDALRTVVAGLHARVRVMRSVSLAQPNRPAQTVLEIEQIVEAVERRDAEATSFACSFHVEQAGRTAQKAVAQGTDTLN